MSFTYMTEEGLQKLKEDLEHMESVERPRITRMIAEARDKGDLSENAEYDAAKESQGILEAKIAQLKGLIAGARLIDESSISTDKVQIMNRVTIKNVKSGKEMTYLLVSENEADLKSGKIAVNSPIAQGLLGKKVGDVAEIEVPSGTITFEVLDISV